VTGVNAIELLGARLSQATPGIGKKQLRPIWFGEIRDDIVAVLDAGLAKDMADNGGESGILSPFPEAGSQSILSGEVRRHMSGNLMNVYAHYFETAGMSDESVLLATTSASS